MPLKEVSRNMTLTDGRLIVSVDVKVWGGQDKYFCQHTTSGLMGQGDNIDHAADNLITQLQQIAGLVNPKPDRVDRLRR